MKTTMLTSILASTAIFGLATGSAFGESEGGTLPNTAFTTLPGVVAAPPVQAVSAADMSRYRSYAATQDHGTWVFAAS